MAITKPIAIINVTFHASVLIRAGHQESQVNETDMDAEKLPQADFDKLLAQVAEHREHVRRLQEEVERLTKMIDECRLRPEQTPALIY